MKTITTKERKDGYYDFYYGKQNVTWLWMDFFSGLSFDEEKDCVQLFIKKYGKRLENKN